MAGVREVQSSHHFIRKISFLVTLKPVSRSLASSRRIEVAEAYITVRAQLPRKGWLSGYEFFSMKPMQHSARKSMRTRLPRTSCGCVDHLLPEVYHALIPKHANKNVALVYHDDKRPFTDVYIIDIDRWYDYQELNQRNGTSFFAVKRQIDTGIPCVSLFQKLYTEHQKNEVDIQDKH